MMQLAKEKIMTNKITKALNSTDIEKYGKLIEKEGKVGVDKIYSDMMQRGYHSAIWNKNEFACDTDFGLNNVNLIMQQNDISYLNRESLDALYIITAKSILTTISNIIKNKNWKQIKYFFHIKKFFKNISSNIFCLFLIVIVSNKVLAYSIEEEKNNFDRVLKEIKFCEISDLSLRTMIYYLNYNEPAFPFKHDDFFLRNSLYKEINLENSGLLLDFIKTLETFSHDRDKVLYNGFTYSNHSSGQLADTHFYFSCNKDTYKLFFSSQFFLDPKSKDGFITATIIKNKKEKFNIFVKIDTLDRIITIGNKIFDKDKIKSYYENKSLNKLIHWNK